MELAALPVRYPSIYLIGAPFLALGALSPTPSLPPLVLLLALLRLHFFTAIPRGQWGRTSLQIVFVSIAAGVRHFRSSLQALSTPFISLAVLTGLSTLTTCIAATAIIAGYIAERKTRSNRVRTTAFPAVWATAWAAVEYCSPIGQLATWSPVTQLGGYAWLRQVGGQPVINWVVAAWSVVIAEAVGAWVVGAESEDSLQPLEVPPLAVFTDQDLPPSDRATFVPRRKASSRGRSTLALTAFLLALAAPSCVISDAPSPVSALDVTPIDVACALPFPQKNGKLMGPPGLKDYVEESRKLQAQAKIILWPESAVRFDSRDDRMTALEDMRPLINNGTYYGIGFEETAHEDSTDGVWKVGMRRNGLVLLGWEGVVYEYYKRHLVPIAESFSMTPGKNLKPSIFTMQLKHPSKTWTAPSWAPGPNHTRPIDVTASICLDFSTASSFTGLPSRPALILAPARTWHTSVGLAMWEQAKARAEETGSMVLWCDGGAGGVSGVVGRGMHAFRQLGPGSWAQTVSVPWPYNESRTVFAVAGTRTVLIALWGVMGMGWVAGVVGTPVGSCMRGVVGANMARALRGVQAVVRMTRQLRERGGEERPLLE